MPVYSIGNLVFYYRIRPCGPASRTFPVELLFIVDRWIFADGLTTELYIAFIAQVM
jgi:hypothetical protein